jgi:hypothetical protein
MKMLDLEDLEADARRRFGATADAEIPYTVDPDRRAKFDEWRFKRRAERAAKAGVAWDDDLADGPRHTGLEPERRKRTMKLSESEKKQYKNARDMCKSLRSNAALRDKCDALAAAIDGCMNSDEDGEKAAKAAFGNAVNATAAELIDAGDRISGIVALRMNPQGPNPNFDGK